MRPADDLNQQSQPEVRTNEPGWEEEAPKTAASSRNAVVREILDWAKYILGAVIIGFLLTNYVIQRNEVVGTSMYPTLQDRDQLWVEKITPQLGSLHRGDIITFTVEDERLGDGSEDLVKRIIAIPGDHLVITEAGVTVNGELLEEEYLMDGMGTQPSNNPDYNDLVLGPEEYYVMGDNRINSRDSRMFGPIQEDSIIGEVWIRIYPFDRFGKP